MMANLLLPTITPTPDSPSIEALLLDSLPSYQSKRAYRKAIRDFIAWCEMAGCRSLNKAVVQQYRAELEGRGLAAATVNLRLTAVRRLAAEAADNGLLEPQLAAGVARIRGVKSRGVRCGHWLTREQAEELLRLPDPASRKGSRDRLLLGLLIGCGLRRNELAGLEFADIQLREGRWVIANLVGKGGRLRTVPMPAWGRALLDAWSDASGLTSGRILRAVNKSDRVLAEAISPQSVFNIVKAYTTELGVDVAPHDLRRTFAHLAHRGHAALEQIQLSLGHTSILTTERYLGIRQDLTDAPCDHLGLTIGKA